ncbi:conserved hypothetical protein [Neospora caninum Liverpool]|uniref:C2H2-type domain-containing protein n=1 Tax=Neospora caninum (strain Liverpool) TaxID=572307 RepID=F0VGD3_NEOCL|nr:conserved hypothetical protein [Neospora caninum Liverpool]CBZ52777.1 conserved hypothetical protein [Neospora caninum Liverpool]CEL66759.1 TPA: hypothetical protein BN1204_025650 [Neospora caninum Liverpool]|eukprot:XP_003882809.1 conserved hypothetical protein [Neospora caninum Liverpool]
MVEAERGSSTSTKPGCLDTSRDFLSLASPPPSSFSRFNIDLDAVAASRLAASPVPSSRKRLRPDCLSPRASAASPVPCPSPSARTASPSPSPRLRAPPVSRYLQQLHPSLLPPPFRRLVVHALEREARAKQTRTDDEASSSVSSASAFSATAIYHLPTQTASVSQALLPSSSIFLLGFLQYLRSQRREHQAKQRQLLLESLLHADRFAAPLSASSALTSALRALYEAKPHLCFTCSRRFATSAQKTAHLRMHMELQQLSQTEEASVFSRRKGHAVRQRLAAAAASRPLWGGVSAWIQVAAAPDVFQRKRMLLQSQLMLPLGLGAGVQTPHASGCRAAEETLGSVRVFLAERVADLRSFAALEAKQTRGDGGADWGPDETRKFPSWFPRRLQRWLTEEWDVACAPGTEREREGAPGGREEDEGSLREERETMDCEQEREPESEPRNAHKPFMTKTEMRTWAWAFQDCENQHEHDTAAREICSLSCVESDARGVRTPQDGSEAIADPSSHAFAVGEGDPGCAPSPPGTRSIAFPADAQEEGRDLPEPDADQPRASLAGVSRGVCTPNGALCPVVRAAQRTLLRQLTREVCLHLGSLSSFFEEGSSSLVSPSSSVLRLPLSQAAEEAAAIAAAEDPPRLFLDSASAPLSTCAFCGEPFAIVFNELQQTLLLHGAVTVAWEATALLERLARQLSALRPEATKPGDATDDPETPAGRLEGGGSALKEEVHVNGDAAAREGPQALGICGEVKIQEEGTKREETEGTRSPKPELANSRAPAAPVGKSDEGSARSGALPLSETLPLGRQTGHASERPLSSTRPASLLLPHLTRSSDATDAYALHCLQQVPHASSSACQQLCGRWSLQPAVLSVAETVEAVSRENASAARQEQPGDSAREIERQAKSLEEAVALLEGAVATGDFLHADDVLRAFAEVEGERDKAETENCAPVLTTRHGARPGGDARHPSPLDDLLVECTENKSVFSREAFETAGTAPDTSPERQDKIQKARKDVRETGTVETVEELFPPNVVYLHCSCFTQLLRESEALLRLVRLLREHKATVVSAFEPLGADRGLDKMSLQLEETLEKLSAFHRLRPSLDSEAGVSRLLAEELRGGFPHRAVFSGKREREDGKACKVRSREESKESPTATRVPWARIRATDRARRRRFR